MSAMAVLTHSPSSPLTSPTSQFTNRRRPMHSIAFNVRRRETKLINLPTSCKPSTSCIRNFQDEDAETFEVASSRETTEGQDKVADQVFGNPENRTTGTGISFLAKLAIALGVAATITLISVGFKRYMNGSPQGVNYLGHGSPASVLTAPSAGFTLNVFGHKIVIPEYAPGWIYFWLLMAAGCGIAISEEALNIWVCPLYWLAYPYRVCCLWMEHGSLLLNHSPEMRHTYYQRSCGCTVRNWQGESNGNYSCCAKIWKPRRLCGAFFSWSEKSYSFPSRNTGCFSRILLCWSLLWWLDHPSTSVSGWVLVEGAPHSCRCNSCICSWTLDGVPIRSSCINCIVPFSPTPLLQLVLLITVCLIHKSQWQNRYKLPKSMIRRHRFILPMVAATLC